MTTAATVAVSQSDTDVELLPTSPRRTYSIYNDAPATLLVILGPAADEDAYSFPLGPGDFYESPSSYDGPVHGIWEAAGAGVARVTEHRV